MAINLIEQGSRTAKRAEQSVRRSGRLGTHGIQAPKMLAAEYALRESGLFLFRRYLFESPWTESYEL